MNYQKHYDQLMRRALTRELEGYKERHHIVPKCLGGGEENNLVDLTAREHYVAHQLLVKMNLGHYGVAYAAMLMTRNGCGMGRVTNRFYGWLKERFAAAKSIESSKQMKGNKHLLGFKHSEESKKKMSEARKNKPMSEEHKRNVIAALKRRGPPKGWKCSEESKERLRKQSTGKKHSEETKAKMRAAKTKEARQKIANAVRSRVISEETRKRMSESAKLRCERERIEKNNSF